MVRENQDSVADAAWKLYDAKLRKTFDPKHIDEFVAIEPISGKYFLARTLIETIGASSSKYPDRLAHALRVAH